jgi:hypothetical protein
MLRHHRVPTDKYVRCSGSISCGHGAAKWRRPRGAARAEPIWAASSAADPQRQARERLRGVPLVPLSPDLEGGDRDRAFLSAKDQLVCVSVCCDLAISAGWGIVQVLQL